MSSTSTSIDRINELQKRILADEPVTAEEMAEAIRQLRGERVSASAFTSKKKAAPVKVDLDSLFAKKEI